MTSICYSRSNSPPIGVILLQAMERIDVRGDLLGIIHTHKKNLNREKPIWSSDIFGENTLSHISSLPLPPSNLPLTLPLPENPTYMDHSTVVNISRMVLLQKRDIDPSETIILDPIQSLGMYDGIQDSPSCEVSKEVENISDAEWYECADDALNQLVNLQKSLTQHWSEIISTFNANHDVFDEIADHTNEIKLLDLSDQKTESDEENNIEISVHDASPSTILESSIKNEAIMTSWGLLDVVQGTISSNENSFQLHNSELIPGPDLSNLDLQNASLL